MKTSEMRYTLATILLAAITPITTTVPPARATAFSVDQSDLWWNPTESGWGIQFVQRGSVIFATMFVYDPGGKPIWYTATLNSSNAPNWTGDLYATTGPWFGSVPFNPAATGYQKVGTMNWVATDIESGTLSYSVSGVNVTKNLVRQPLVNDEYTGNYGGWLSLRGTCVFAEGFAEIGVVQTGTIVQLTFLNIASGVQCTITGNLIQGGQFGKVAGTFSCNIGGGGSATLSELQVDRSSITAQMSLTDPGCTREGYVGGMRRR